ncbi:uncharacterized protein LOC114520948 [Dendronephthya gigantea]|uniref:uncharacterized protein LOC114520948 n=1 Tax=Dendronephthya gigantea TaxID=151771 RepID=UPI00106D4ECC|nr:uncharacterized protein LOC114520948 [Dendronephthya gigantea]
MAVRPFSKEELNFFKFASIVHDEFPKMLRSTFVALWDRKIAPLPAYQVWDDSPAVRTLLLTLEGGKTPIPTNKSFKDWDCTALFQATIYSKTFRGSTKTTLSDQFIKGKKPSTFHSSLTSLTSTGNPDEIITLAIDQVRLLRNCLCHSPKSILKKHDFDYYVQLAKGAFVATGFSTDQVDHIGNLKESDFPTERVNELNRKIKAVVLESKKFLEERVEKGITKLTDGQESVIQKLDEINRNVIRNQNSNAATMQENRGFAALGALGPAVNNDECIITFKITAEKVRLAKDIGLGTVTLIDIFNACTKAHPSVFQDTLKRGFGDEKDDQKFGEISQGCLLVPLHCLTDERFLEVLDDFESGRLKKRLLTEFSQIGVEIEGLEIEIKNMEEVNKTKDKIKRKLEKSSTNFDKYRQGIVNVQGTDRQSHLKSCIPDKPELFIGRDTIVNQIVSSLVHDACGIVSIVGGPGFGKSTVAIEVSHHLISKENDVVVIFSFLSQAFTIPEVIMRLCHDVGVIPGEDPKSSLMFWLKSIEENVVLVMDNIEQLLERHVKHNFLELVRTLRKNSQQHIQILTTSRTQFSISGTQTKSLQIGEMDETTSVELLEKCCPVKVEKTSLSELAKLCGFIPLALCIAGSRIQD